MARTAASENVNKARKYGKDDGARLDRTMLLKSVQHFANPDETWDDDEVVAYVKSWAAAAERRMTASEDNTERLAWGEGRAKNTTNTVKK